MNWTPSSTTPHPVRDRRWPTRPGDGFHLVGIAFVLALAVLVWQLLVPVV